MTAIAQSIDRWSDDFLDSMRQVMDPLADSAVRSLFEQGDIKAVNRLMSLLVGNDQVVPQMLPECIQQYLKEQGGLPEWASQEVIGEAETLFGRHGPLIGISLLCASLPECYTYAKGVHVLYLTADLLTDTTRRVGETGQMIIDVMAPGGLAPNGDGIRDAQKVRLMHAAVRHLILQSGRWNPEWGQPINQEDMAATLMSFTLTILDSLDMLGAKFKPEEAEAYLYSWKIVGQIMGMRPEMLPEDMADARKLIHAIRRRQAAASDEGRVMTKALIEMMQEHVHIWVKPVFWPTMVRYLLGDQVADLIAVPRAGWYLPLIRLSRRIVKITNRLVDRPGIFGACSGWVGRRLMEGMASDLRDGRAARFKIPSHLCDRWRLRI
jgi:hypothetical protein